MSVASFAEQPFLFCRVCGLEQPSPPWGADGKSPTFDICACCGVEFGYEDSLPAAVEAYRKKWQSAGMKWWILKEKPEGWDLESQLSNIPTEFKKPA